ncbi:peroxidase family protein [Actinoplanes sp. CA-142083]|uniref:peroxidase family protein n=1 Tax=Actinoplanes sp. CA-142083 TaxID=3239903 RepID=UPI003D903E7F
MEVEADAGTYTPAQLDAFRAQGLEVEPDGDEVTVVVPLNKGFFNPDLVPALGLGPLLEAVGGEPQYKNEEMIDNQLRQAFGLPPRTSFTQITGEASAAFPPGTGADSPASRLGFTSLTDAFDTEVDRNDADALEATPTRFARAAPLAARLQAIYGNVNNVDAFVGVTAEPHAPGSELGELQRAMWTAQFRQLRDGDRFFYGNQATALDFIRNTYGIDFRRNLGDIIAQNSGIARADLPANVSSPTATCRRSVAGSLTGSAPSGTPPRRPADSASR